MEEKKDIFDFIEKRPIETPDPSYFKDLADKVMADASASSTTDEPEEPQAKIIPLYRRPVTWISGVAAAASLILFCANKFSKTFSPIAVILCCVVELIFEHS